MCVFIFFFSFLPILDYINIYFWPSSFLVLTYGLSLRLLQLSVVWSSGSRPLPDLGNSILYLSFSRAGSFPLSQWSNNWGMMITDKITWQILLDKHPANRNGLPPFWYWTLNPCQLVSKSELLCWLGLSAQFSSQFLILNNGSTFPSFSPFTWEPVLAQLTT